MKTTTVTTTVTFVLTLIAAQAINAPPAIAKMAAIYGQAQGALGTPIEGSADSSSDGVTPGLGLRAGARLLFLETYADHTVFSDESTTTRAILGVRGGVSIFKNRLVLRAGGGVLRASAKAVGNRAEQDRTGPVARIGASLEREIASRFILAGIGLEAERHWIGHDFEPDLAGTNVLANLYMLFELGL